jgi:hypothetical protein
VNRKGMALLIALIALLVVSGLAAAALAAARLRWLSGSRQLAARLAFEAAAGSSARHVSEWDTVAARGLAPTATTGLSGYRQASLVTYDSLIRLGASLYLVRSIAQVVARDGSVQARDGVAQLVEAGPDTVGSWVDPMCLYYRDNIVSVSGCLPRSWWRWP